MDDLIQDFLMETSENLEQLDVDIVELEKDHNNKELLSNIFRTIHTIKGTCGFIGLPRLEKVAHKGEDVLGRFREGDLDVTPEAITAILNCIDTIKEIMGTIEETGQEPEGDDTALIAELDQFMQMDGSTGSSDTSETDEETVTVDENQSVDMDTVAQDGSTTPPGDNENNDILNENAAEDDASENPDDIFTPIPMDGAVFNEEQTSNDDTPDVPPAQETANTPEDTTLKAEAEPKKPAPAAKPPAAKAPAQGRGDKPSIANQNIRVNVSMLENLITSVSELVLARNQLLQIARNSDNDEFKVPLQRLNHITSELQEGLMQTRMQPVGTAWSQLPRIVRDLSTDLKKEIELEMIGAETELDRQVIEIIKDPLMHMVRNSADHGLEIPQERLDAGKGRQGKIVLKAYHAGGHVVIEIRDDGKGLNKDRIVEKILNNGLATPEQLENMSDTAIYNHIFAAGFSTAAVVTNVSGRGVGMDVVRSNIEKIGGSVEVDSKQGHGSIFTVKIPLTLAIVSALIIRSGGQRFAIPQVSIIELVQASDDSEHTVEYVKSHPVLRLRNQLLPLITLSDVLNLTPAVTAKKALNTANASENADVSVSENVDLKSEAKENISTKSTSKKAGDPTNIFDKKPQLLGDALAEDQFIIVAQVGSGQFGIIVDEVYDTEEIVVKPVSKILRSTNLFAGNTILGDGSVVMILDPKSVADKAGDMHARASEAEANAEKTMISSPAERRMRFLLFKAGEGSPKAVPLDLIVRLEEVEPKSIETSNGMSVLQYRDRLMPLTSVSGYVDVTSEEKKSVLVFQQENEYVGIVVDEIVDIVEEDLDLKMNTSMGGSYGSLVINDRTTDLLDVDYFIKQVCPNWSSMVNQSSAKKSKKQETTNIPTHMTVGFVDNCKLYRNLISPLLELQNIKSLSFDSGEQALTYFTSESVPLNAFILDKDSLGEDPGGFLTSCKDNFPNVPLFIVGSTFNASEEVLFREHECIACLAKSDRDSIIVTLKDYLEQTRSLAA